MWAQTRELAGHTKRKILFPPRPNDNDVILSAGAQSGQPRPHLRPKGRSGRPGMSKTTLGHGPPSHKLFWRTLVLLCFPFGSGLPGNPSLAPPHEFFSKPSATHAFSHRAMVLSIRYQSRSLSVAIRYQCRAVQVDRTAHEKGLIIKSF